MNEKKAKALRRRVYGEQSLRISRRYLWANRTKINDPRSLRFKYQREKRNARVEV